MVIFKEKKSFTEGNSPAVIKSFYSNGHLKASIDIDCMAALANITSLRKARYGLAKATPDHVASVFKWMLKDIEATAIDDDFELCQKLSDVI